MIKKIFILAFIGIFSITSCDYIEEPLKTAGEITPDPDPRITRNILIDDFTGHRCVNCPEAAEMIHTLQINPIFKNRVIGLAIHAEFFAEPLPPLFADDYRTPEGDALASLFGVTDQTGFPTGMVNRIDYPGSNLKSVPDWPTLAATFLLDSVAIVGLNPTISYDGNSREATVDVQVTWNENIDNENYNIVVFVSENKIVGTQLTHGNPAVDTNYVFDHVLRGSASGHLGEPIGSTSIAVGDKETHSTSVTLDAAWKQEDCHILIYVYDVITQEVMQVVEESVM